MPPRASGPKLFDQATSSSSPTASSATTGWLNAHCDGGARGNPGPAGFGAVLVDDAGAAVAHLSEFLGNRTNNYAEYSGLLGCLAYSLEHGFRKLRLVSDSELMVKQIQGKYQVKSPELRPLYEEAKRRIASLEAFEITHALRHKNKDADRLANEAMDRGMGRPVAPVGAVVPVIARTEGGSRRDWTDALPEQADGMLRGFTRGGLIHVLGGASLPDGLLVKIIRE